MSESEGQVCQEEWNFDEEEDKRNKDSESLAKAKQAWVVVFIEMDRDLNHYSPNLTYFIGVEIT